MTRPDPDNLEVTIEAAVDDVHAEEFYQLYLAAFGPMRTRAAARQVLHRDEFMADMTDSRVHKYVGWHEGRPITLATMTHHLETVPWISPDFYRARFPEHAARNAIFYLGFILAHPSSQVHQALEQMVEVGVRRLVEAHAVCAFDVCAYNDITRSFTARMTQMLHRHSEVRVMRLDNQQYYGAVFA